MSVIITADSAADLPDEVCEKMNIRVVPMNVVVGGREYKDGGTLTSGDILYSKVPVTTSAISPGEYGEFFSEFTKSGNSVVHISLSSKLSSTYRNALLASKVLGGVRVVDSLNLSGGMAVLCCAAAKKALLGASTDEILDALESTKKKIDMGFVLSDIDRLRRGGRCTALEAFGASVLGLRPSVKVDDGALVLARMYRGSKIAARKKYIADAMNAGEYDKSVCFVNHTLDADAAQKIKKKIESEYGYEKVYLTSAGCCTASHGGKDSVGIALMRL